MYKPEAEKRVKTELVIDAIRKAGKIEPTEADIEKAIADQAERNGLDVETFKKDLTDEQKDYLKDNAAIQLVLDLLKKDATILEKKEEKAEEAKPAKAAKKPAAKKTAKKAEESAEAAEGEAEKKPAKKPAAKKTVKKAEEKAEAAEGEAKKPARKTAAKKKTAEE